jgi:hypothetical protein
MARTRCAAEEIICHLRTIEIEAGNRFHSPTPPYSSQGSREWSSPDFVDTFRA